MNMLIASLFPLAALFGLAPTPPAASDAPAAAAADPAGDPAADLIEPPVIETRVEPAPAASQADVSNEPDLIEAAPVEVTREEILKRAGEALKATKTAKGTFIQTDSYGERVSGDFYIRRPGRIRFEYGSPARLLVVSDGTTVSYKDMELETDDRIPLSATPLKLFLGRDVDLADDANVVDVSSLANQHLIAVEDNRSDAEDRVDGQLILMFARDSYDLLGWWAIDGAGGQTKVDLLQVQTNVDLNAKLFVIEDDEDDRRR